MNELEILFAALWGYSTFSTTLIILLYLLTPGFTFLKSRLKKVPTLLILQKHGNSRWKTPNRIEDGWAIFKGRFKGSKIRYRLSQMGTTKTNKGDITMALDGIAIAFSPELLASARNLSKHFNTYTETDVAYILYQLEKEYGVKLTPKSKAITVTNEDGTIEKIDILEEVERRGENDMLDYREEAGEVLSRGSHRDMGKVLDDFQIMQHFYRYDIPATVLDELESSVRAEERIRAQQGMFGKLNRETAMGVMIILVSIGIVYVMLVATGGLDWLVAQFRPPSLPNIPVPTTLPGTPTGINVK